MSIDSITTCDGKTLRFKSPLAITAKRADGLWTLFNERYSVSAWSATLSCAFDSLRDELAMLHDEYFAGDPSGMTGDAVELKSRLADIFPS